ncbi:MAG TPA: hypothetical protein DDW73_20615 [Rhizobium sp.]|nr:hypothetical protein [Rhizobium sp.]
MVRGALEFVWEKGNPVFTKRQTKTKEPGVCLVQSEPDRLQVQKPIRVSILRSSSQQTWWKRKTPARTDTNRKSRSQFRKKPIDSAKMREKIHCMDRLSTVIHSHFRMKLDKIHEQTRNR